MIRPGRLVKCAVVTLFLLLEMKNGRASLPGRP